MLFNCKRTATVKAKIHATIAKIVSEKFLEVIEKYPNIIEELKLRAANTYNDPLTKKIDKFMTKIPYMRTLNDLQYIHLVYSAKKEYVSPNTVILDYGDEPHKVYFLLEGSIDLYFLTRGKRTHHKVKVIEFEERLLFTTYTIRKRPDKESCGNEFDMYICHIRGLSILCATQALIKAPISIKLTTVTPCQFLVIDAADIVRISQTVKGNLSGSIAIMRNKHLEGRYDSIVVDTPIIDIFRFFSSKSDKFEFKTKLKIKRCVLKIIMKMRKKQRTEGLNLFVITNRLICMKKLLGVSWEEFRREVENGRVRSEDIEIAQMLHYKNRNNSALIHMGNAVQNMRNGTLMMEDKLRGARDLLEEIEEEDKKTQEEIQFFHRIVDTLKGLLT